MPASPTLIPLARDLWTAELHRYGPGLHLRTRMTVVRLRSGGLWLHSPIEIDDALAGALAELGPVQHIVAPNRFHWRFAAASRARYADAALWAAPGLACKRPEIRFDAALWDHPHPWHDAIDAVKFDGFPALSETVFLHRASRTLICTDALFNVHDEPHAVTRLFWRAFGVWRHAGQNRAWRWMLKDRVGAIRAAGRILDWEFDRITMCHGDVIERGGHALMRGALAWLIGPDDEVQASTAAG